MNYFQKHLFQPIEIEEPPSLKLGMIITIPCFNEKNVLDILNSLENCDPPGCDVEVIIHVNASEVSGEEIHLRNKYTLEEFHGWNRNRKFSYFILSSPNLPAKHAGVGLARKIAMDEAAYRLYKIDNSKGVIVCLDADCTVEKNYLVEI